MGVLGPFSLTISAVQHFRLGLAKAAWLPQCSLLRAIDQDLAFSDLTDGSSPRWPGLGSRQNQASAGSIQSRQDPENCSLGRTTTTLAGMYQSRPLVKPHPMLELGVIEPLLGTVWVAGKAGYTVFAMHRGLGRKRQMKYQANLKSEQSQN